MHLWLRITMIWVRTSKCREGKMGCNQGKMDACGCRSILLMKHYPSLKTTPMRQFLTITLNKKSNSFVDFHISNSNEACICYCLLLSREQRLFIELFLIFCLQNSVSKELNSNSQLSLLLIPGLCHCLATSQNSPSQH